MSKGEKMNIDARRKYLPLVKLRYSKAGRKEKGWLLDEMQADTDRADEWPSGALAAPQRTGEDVQPSGG